MESFNNFIEWLSEAIENIISGIEAFIEKIQEFASGFDKTYNFESE